MNPLPSKFFVAALLLLSAIFGSISEVRATVTLEVQFDNGAIPAGSLAVLVADTNGDDFVPLTDASVSGSRLSIGESIGTSDDKIIAVFSSVAGPQWFSGAGFADTIPSIDYSALGIVEGTPLVIYVFPELSAPGTLFILGDEFITYRNSAVGGSRGDIPFEAPADPGVYRLASLTAPNGGNFDPLNPTPDETYLTGNTGTTGSGGSDDHGDSRKGATPITSGPVGGNLGPGDLDFFEFLIEMQTTISATVSGDPLLKVWIFDEFGNLIYMSTGSGTTPFVINQLLEPGRYSLAMQGADEMQTGDYVLDLFRVPSQPHLTQGPPDITIGESLGKQIGENIYNASGSGQKYSTKVKAGKKVRAFLTVGIDGELETLVALNGPIGNKFYSLKYLSLSGGGNVTAALKRGGYVVNYPANTSGQFRVDLNPTRLGKNKGKKANFNFEAVAPGVGSLDRAKIQSKVIRKTKTSSGKPRNISP